MPSDTTNNDDKAISELARQVTQNGDTEPPFSGDLLTENRPGTYHCTVCDQPLFASTAKYKSGTGWPSFSTTIEPNNVQLKADSSLDQNRTEVVCARCDAHLGHVFADGPTEKTADVPATGKRYCINSAALTFHSADSATDL